MQARQVLDGRKTYILRPAGLCKGTWELRCNSHEQERVDSFPGLRWDANVWTWVEVKRDLGGSEMWHSLDETRPGWKWDTNIVTRLYVRCKSRGLGRRRTILHLYIAPGWRSDGTWKEVIQIYWNLDSGLTGSAVSSDTHLETCMSLKCWLDGSQMQFCESGLDGAEMPFCGPGWRWVVTKMEVKHKYQDMNLVETRPRWRGEINLGAWLGVMCKSWDLAEGKMGHGLSWDSHFETWIHCNGTTSRIVVGCEYRDLDECGKGEGEMRIFVI